MARAARICMIHPTPDNKITEFSSSWYGRSAGALTCQWGWVPREGRSTRSPKYCQLGSKSFQTSFYSFHCSPPRWPSWEHQSCTRFSNLSVSGLRNPMLPDITIFEYEFKARNPFKLRSETQSELTRGWLGQVASNGRWEFCCSSSSCTVDIAAARFLKYLLQ